MAFNIIFGFVGIGADAAQHWNLLKLTGVMSGATT
jgi:hypothetical protein